MNDDAWQTVMRTTLFVWFIIMNLFVLIPGVLMLLDAEPKRKLPDPPASVQVVFSSEASKGTTPDVQARQFEALTRKVALYKQAVQAYEEHVTAYNKLMDQSSKSCEADCGWSLPEVYELVVKDCLVPLITALVAGLVGYAFVSAGREILTRYLARRRDDVVHEPPQ